MNRPLASERFARHAIATRYEDLAEGAVLQAKTFILDTLGVGIAGSSAAGAGELLRVSTGWGEAAQACVSCCRRCRVIPSHGRGIPAPRLAEIPRRMRSSG